LSYRGILSNKSTKLIYNQNIIDYLDNVKNKEMPDKGNMWQYSSCRSRVRLLTER